MEQVKRGADESPIPLFSHPTLRFSKVALAMHQQQYILLVVFQGWGDGVRQLMSDGPDLDELFRQSTKYVDKIVRATNPSDLPEKFPTRYALISILRFAKALDLTIQGDRITERIAALHESVVGTRRSTGDVRSSVAIGCKADIVQDHAEV